MRKKILMICAVSIIATAVVTNQDYAKAASRTIQSYGNLVLRDGSQMAIYSSDVQYLKEELDSLFNELPHYYNNSEDDSFLEEE